MPIPITSTGLVEIQGAEGKVGFILDVSVVLPGTDKPFHIPFLLGPGEGNYISDVFGKEVVRDIINSLTIRR